MTLSIRDVRFTPESRHSVARYGSANRSPSHIEPVSSLPKRKLENGEQRLAPESHQSRPEIPEFADQRLGRASLTCGNVGCSHAPGNRIVETALTGWGGRIRTSEWRNRNLPDHFESHAYFFPTGGQKRPCCFNGLRTISRLPNCRKLERMIKDQHKGDLRLDWRPKGLLAKSASKRDVWG
jgi:hypothetical protein